jgi:hypothetical protein
MTVAITGSATRVEDLAHSGVDCALHEELDLPTLDERVVAMCRDLTAGLTARIIYRIRHEVAAFASNDGPQVEAAITEAIRSAVDTFMDAVAHRPTDTSAVFAFYRHLGALQAEAGHDLDAMQAAHQIATQESWDELRHVTSAMGLPPEVVALTGNAVMTYQRLLLDQAVIGFAEVRARQPCHRRDTSARLLIELMTRNRPASVKYLAEQCGWPVPPEAVVITAHVADDAELSPALARHPLALAGVRHRSLVVVTDAEAADDLARLLTERVPGTVTITWAVPVDEVHHATRWAARTLALADQGIIDVPADRLVRCRDHQARLCLHADPTLRRHANEHLLAPLLAERPKRRAALAETMLLWLQTRHSAPVLAGLLGVHEQTVRHRLRALKTMFVDELADPNHTVGLLSALESTMPAWRREVV